MIAPNGMLATGLCKNTATANHPHFPPENAVDLGINRSFLRHLDVTSPQDLNLALIICKQIPTPISHRPCDLARFRTTTDVKPLPADIALTARGMLFALFRPIRSSSPYRVTDGTLSI
jgi:hypothetical protein